MNVNRATLNEIQTQTLAWAEAIQAVEKRQAQISELSLDEYCQLLFCGCGSTYYLSLSAAALFQSLSGKISRAFPSSELLLSQNSVYPGQNQFSLLIAVSRSGTTTETLRAVQSFKELNKGTVLAVTNYEESPLASMGKVSICIPSGKEQSVAQTKSFTSMYMACTSFAAVSNKKTEIMRSLPELIPFGDRLIKSYDGLAQEIGQNQAIKRFFFLGSGIQYGLACEASLKMKEMSLTESEPFHFFEFRHGPISMVDPSTMVVGLISEKYDEYETAVLADVKRLGGKTLTLGEINTDIEFKSHLPETTRGVLYLPFLQLMSCYRSLSFNLDPDKPRNLTAVVKLKF